VNAFLEDRKVPANQPGIKRTLGYSQVRDDIRAELERLDPAGFGLNGIGCGSPNRWWRDSS
jgi:hypothetical protein